MTLANTSYSLGAIASHVSLVAYNGILGTLIATMITSKKSAIIPGIPAAVLYSAILLQVSHKFTIFGGRSFPFSRDD